MVRQVHPLNGEQDVEEKEEKRDLFPSTRRLIEALSPGKTAAHSSLDGSEGPLVGSPSLHGSATHRGTRRRATFAGHDPLPNFSDVSRCSTSAGSTPGGVVGTLGSPIGSPAASGGSSATNTWGNALLPLNQSASSSRRRNTFGAAADFASTIFRGITAQRTRVDLVDSSSKDAVEPLDSLESGTRPRPTSGKSPGSEKKNSFSPMAPREKVPGAIRTFPENPASPTGEKRPGARGDLPEQKEKRPEHSCSPSRGGSKRSQGLHSPEEHERQHGQQHAKEGEEVGKSMQPENSSKTSEGSLLPPLMPSKDPGKVSSTTTVTTAASSTREPAAAAAAAAATVATAAAAAPAAAAPAAAASADGEVQAAAAAETAVDGAAHATTSASVAVAADADLSTPALVKPKADAAAGGPLTLDLRGPPRAPALPARALARTPPLPGAVRDVDSVVSESPAPTSPAESAHHTAPASPLVPLPALRAPRGLRIALAPLPPPRYDSQNDHGEEVLASIGEGATSSSPLPNNHHEPLYTSVRVYTDGSVFTEAQDLHHPRLSPGSSPLATTFMHLANSPVSEDAAAFPGSAAAAAAVASTYYSSSSSAAVAAAAPAASLSYSAPSAPSLPLSRPPMFGAGSPCSSSPAAASSPLLLIPPHGAAHPALLLHAPASTSSASSSTAAAAAAAAAAATAVVAAGQPAAGSASVCDEASASAAAAAAKQSLPAAVVTAAPAKQNLPTAAVAARAGEKEEENEGGQQLAVGTAAAAAAATATAEESKQQEDEDRTSFAQSSHHHNNNSSSNNNNNNSNINNNNNSSSNFNEPEPDRSISKELSEIEILRETEGRTRRDQLGDPPRHRLSWLRVNTGNLPGHKDSPEADPDDDGLPAPAPIPPPPNDTLPHHPPEPTAPLPPLPVNQDDYPVDRSSFGPEEEPLQQQSEGTQRSTQSRVGTPHASWMSPSFSMQDERFSRAGQSEQSRQSWSEGLDWNEDGQERPSTNSTSMRVSQTERQRPARSEERIRTWHTPERRLSKRRMSSEGRFPPGAVGGATPRRVRSLNNCSPPPVTRSAKRAGQRCGTHTEGQRYSFDSQSNCGRRLERRHTLTNLDKIKDGNAQSVWPLAPLGRPRAPRAEAGETFLALQRSALGLNEVRVRELLNAGVSANIPLREESENGVIVFVTLLHQLCGLPVVEGGRAEPGSIAVMEALMRAGANVSPRSSTGMTPLMTACREKNMEAVDLLLRWNAEVDVTDDVGNSPLVLAALLPQEAVEPTTAQYLSTSRGGSSSFGNATNGVPLLPQGAGVGPVHPSQGPSSGYVMGSERSIPDSANPTTPRRSKSFRCTVGFEDAMTISAKLVEMLMAVEDDQEKYARAGQGPVGFQSRRYLEEDFTADSKRLGQSFCESDSALNCLRQCVAQGNHLALQVLLGHGVEPLYLTEAVERGNVRVVWALLDFRADPLDMDATGVSAMDVALQKQSVLGSGTPFDDVLDALRAKALLTVRDSDLLNPDPLRRKGKSLSILSKKSTGREPVSPSDGRRSRSFDTLIPKRVSIFRSSAQSGELSVSRRSTSRTTCFKVQERGKFLYESQYFQGLTFLGLLGALFLPDLMVILDTDDYDRLDATLLAILVLFIIELKLQVIAYRRAYFCTFFFFMDLVGACSLLLDLSSFRNLTEGAEGQSNPVAQNVVIARAARAAKLGARAGRFTKIVKVLRFFLPNHSASQQGPTVDTAKHIGGILMSRVSTQVSCLIICMVTLLPTFNILRYPEQDLSLLFWTERLDAIMHYTDESERKTELAYLIDDMKTFYDGMAYEPYRLEYTNLDGEIVQLWHSVTPTRVENRIKIESGDVSVAFDFQGINTREAAINSSIIILTILLMMFFSYLISTSVTQKVLDPLEGVLSKVRHCASSIYQRAENMHRTMRNWRRCSEGIQRGSSLNLSLRGEEEEEDFTAETLLLEKVIGKIAVLSEIAMQRNNPQDEETLHYLGQSEVKHTFPEVQRVDSEISAGRYGSCQDNSERWERLQEFGIGTWALNPLDLEAPVLAEVTVATILHSEVSDETLRKFVDEVATRYHSGAHYHTWRHAVDVTHTLWVMIQSFNSGTLTILSRLEEFALLVSAACHDVGHPGLSNDFLVQTSHELAIRYNDTSPLENMHCATLFEIVKNPAFDVFSVLDGGRRKEARAICIEAILGSDNVRHVEHVKALLTFGEMKSELLEASKALADAEEEGGGGAWPPRELVEALCETEARQMIRNATFHLADISNPVKAFPICKAWALHVLEEFFAQGDRLQEMGLPVPALLDRKKTNKPFSQISFIEFFVGPCVFATVRILAPLRVLQDQMVSNAYEWSVEWQAELDPPEDEVQGVTARLKRLDMRASSVRPVRGGEWTSSRHDMQKDGRTVMSRIGSVLTGRTSLSFVEPTLTSALRHPGRAVSTRVSLSLAD